MGLNYYKKTAKIYNFAMAIWIQLLILHKTVNVKNKTNPMIRDDFCTILLQVLCTYIFCSLVKLDTVWYRHWWHQHLLAPGRWKHKSILLLQTHQCSLVINSLLPYMRSFSLQSDSTVLGEKKNVLDAVGKKIAFR